MNGNWDPSLDAAPLISCVMPTYGRPEFVNEAVAMFLSQDYPLKELIVLNDCPGQEFVGEIPGVRFVNCEKRFATLGEKRNACIEATNGSLIAVWDDDDIYLPWRLSFSLREMQVNRTGFYRAAEFWAYWGDASLHDNQSVPGWVNHPNTLFAKSLWHSVGGYPAQGVGEDAEFFAKIHRLLKQDFIKFPVDRADRFFVLRGTSVYAHMSIPGGAKPPDLSPGRRVVVPCPIADPVLRSACDNLIESHNRCTVQNVPDVVAPALSVCVSIKNRSRVVIDGRTLELFPKCVRSLSEAARGCGKVELIVADFHSDDWALAEWLPAAAGNLAHRIISIDGPFSKGKGLNIAADAALGRRVLFLDADMLLNRDVLRRAIEVVDQGSIWLPIYRRLDQSGNAGDWEDFSVGNVAFDRALWQQSRPVPEFQSWGGEDNIFADKLQEHRPAVRERFEGFFHQWHPDDCRHKFYARPAKTDYCEYVSKQIVAAPSSTSDRVCIVTLETPEIAEHCLEMAANKLNYARRWKHDFLCLEKPLSADLPPHYSKIAVVNHLLATGMHDQIWWIDMDCVFTDFRCDLSRLLQPGNWLAALNESSAEPNICSGLLLIRNCDESREVFRVIADDVARKPTLQHPFEQTHINRVLAARNWSGVQLCTVDEVGAFSEVWYCHRPWRKGDRTLHLAGSETSWALRRKLFLQNYLPLVLQ